MRRYCILAWLPPNPEEKRVVVTLDEIVWLFDDYRVAFDWAIDELTPDWEFVVLPVLTLVVEK